jgi:hypothetical protein
VIREMAWKRALVSALVIWIFGYGALRLFSSVATYPSELPGLDSFRSATWGDGVALPIYAAGLVLLRGQLPKPKYASISIYAGILGLLAGCFVIWNWLYGTDQVLNWTMPQPGVLNLAGIWHAGFLISASAYFSFQTVDFGCRLRAMLSSSRGIQTGRRILRSGTFVVTMSAINSYIILAAVDGAKASSSRAGLSSLIALAIALSVILIGLLWVARGATRDMWVAFLVGSLVAGACVSAILISRQEWVVFLFVLAAILFGLCVGIDVHGIPNSTAKAHKSALNWQEMLSVSALSALFVMAASRTRIEHLEELGSLVLLLLVIVGAVAYFRHTFRPKVSIREDYSWLVIAFVFLVTTAGALMVSESGELEPVSTSFFFGLLATLLAGPTIKLCKHDFQIVMDMEVANEASSNGLKFTPEQTRLSTLIHTRLILCLLASIAAILGLSLLTAQQLPWNYDEATIGFDIFSAASLSALLLVVGILSPAIVRGIRTKASWPVLAGKTWNLAVIYLSLACIMLATVGFTQVTTSNIFNLFAIIQSALITLFSVECIYGNGIRLRLMRINPESTILCAIVGISLFIISYWSLTVAIGTVDNPVGLGYSFVALLVSYAITFLIVVTTTSLVGGTRPVQCAQFDKPVQLAGQDMAMLLPMWIFAAWIPQTVAAHIVRQQSDIARWIMIAIVIIGFIALYVSALLWLTKNNDTHNARSREKWNLHVPFHFRPEASHIERFLGLVPRLKESIRPNAEGGTEERHAIALSSHTAIQNAVSFLLVSCTVLGFFWLIPSDLKTGSADED